MKKALKNVLCLSLASMIALFAAGCGNKGNTSTKNSNSSVVSEKENNNDAASASDYKISYDDNGKTVTIDYCKNKKAKIYDIPSEIENRKVVAISDNAFDFDAVEEIIVPGTVEKIGEFSFSFTSKLEKVTLNEGVKEIGTDCFEQDTSLSEVTIPSTLKVIPSCSFVYCTSLEKIFLPEGVERIEEGAFSHCEKLKEIHIPGSVTFIQRGTDDKSSAFYDDENVTIYAPKGSYAEKYAEQENIKFVAE